MMMVDKPMTSDLVQVKDEGIGVVLPSEELVAGEKDLELMVVVDGGVVVLSLELAAVVEDRWRSLKLDMVVNG